MAEAANPEVATGFGPHDFRVFQPSVSSTHSHEAGDVYATMDGLSIVGQRSGSAPGLGQIRADALKPIVRVPPFIVASLVYHTWNRNAANACKARLSTFVISDCVAQVPRSRPRTWDIQSEKAPT